MDKLTQKAGPLPIWAWALIGLAVLGVGYYLYKSGAFSGGGGNSLPASPNLAGDSGLSGLGVAAQAPLQVLSTRGVYSATGSGAGPIDRGIAGVVGGQVGPGDPHGPPYNFGGPNRGGTLTRPAQSGSAV